MPNTVNSVEKASSKKLIVIAGPTAVGKTSMAIEIAQAFSCEILSFDSRQFYRELEIGSAPPSSQELELVPHHFIMDRSVREELNAAAFAKEAEARIKERFQDHDHLVLVGGSGLYLQALIEGFDDIPEVHPKHREALNQKFTAEGIKALQTELEAKDPKYYQIVDINNPQRIIRALEVIRDTGKAFSSFRQQSRKKLPYSLKQFVLEEDREVLYDRINQRVDLMIDAGLENEAESLIGEQKRSSLQTVGYKEFFKHFAGEYDLAHCIEEIKKNSRRYAKRQITWFKRKEEMQWFYRKDTEGILRSIANA